jgi:ATP/maltotriose-dependent transcriptional regulator MalT
MRQASAVSATDGAAAATEPFQRRAAVNEGVIDPLPVRGDAGKARSAALRAVAAERSRIGQKLDDKLGDSLLGISMIADSLALVADSDDTQALGPHLRELIRLAQLAVSEVRSCINKLNEKALGGEASAATQHHSASEWRAAARSASCPVPLRPREIEVMELIAEGLKNREIAARLVISEKTVKNHISSIYGRFAVEERRQAVAFWLETLTELSTTGRLSTHDRRAL